jgi:predicted DNA-binding transcriptional regulator YafY
VKADRLVSILLMLQSSQQRPARELAAALEVSERTIYRDVDALGAAGVPVFAQRGAAGGISLSAGYKNALTHFGEEEIRALFISGPAVLADLGLGANLDLALEKLRGGFSDVQRRVAEKARGRIHIDQRRWYASDPPVEKLALLRRAVWDDRCLELRYEDRSKSPTTRPVDPYGLVSKAGIWYLVARTQEGFRTFRADRIVDVRELPTHFERSADFDLNGYWKQSSAAVTGKHGEGYAVTLRVEATAVDMVRGYWPVEPLDAADLSLVRVTFSSAEVALHHVLAWGAGVEVIEPDALRRAIVDRAHALLERYAREISPGPVP